MLLHPGYDLTLTRFLQIYRRSLSDEMMNKRTFYLCDQDFSMWSEAFGNRYRHFQIEQTVVNAFSPLLQTSF